MRITINEKASRALEKIKVGCTERKISLDAWTTIVSEALLSVPQSVWQEQIESHTPTSYLMEKALKDPKLSKQITEFLREKMATTKADTDVSQ